ncbi:hypothetical protein EMIT0P176_120028 [Pseudomonas sp. IT-P176]
MKLLFQKRILSLGLRGGGGAGLCVPPRGFMGGVLADPLQLLAVGMEKSIVRVRCWPFSAGRNWRKSSQSCRW